MSTAPDPIWADDLLERGDEARQLQTFLVNRARERAEAGIGGAYVLALDAPYGEGKTFFLERLKAQVGAEHPVAWIDAWADDTADEPMTALMAAVEDAISPYLGAAGRYGDAWSLVKNEGTRLLGHATAAFGKRLVTRYFGDEFLEQVGSARPGQDGSEDSESGKDADAAGDAAKDAIAGMADRLADAQLTAYRARRESVRRFRRQLTKLIASLDKASEPPVPPMFIFIDELDRCRPTYAIRMLEEIKHLFDVPRLVFVLGINGSQLEASVKALYGSEFAARDYLQRFVNREYSLQEPDYRKLVALLLRQSGVPVDKLAAPVIGTEDDISYFIAASLRFYRFSARSAAQVVDYLHTFATLWQFRTSIQLPYLLPLILQKIRGRGWNMAADPVTSGFPVAQWQVGSTFETPQSLFEAFGSVSDTSPRRILTAISVPDTGAAAYADHAAREFAVAMGPNSGITMAMFYGRALENVPRFHDVGAAG